MNDLITRQIELEDEYSNASIAAGQRAVLDAFAQGRAADIGTGRILLAKAFEVAVPDFEAKLKERKAGYQGKYLGLLRQAPAEVTVMACLREVISACANPIPVVMQDILRRLGRVIEAEAILSYLDKINPTYTNRTLEYLDTSHTMSVSHRYRTLLAGANNLGLDWESWGSEERVACARILLSSVYESTGLFVWKRTHETASYYVAPSDALEKHLTQVQDAARAVVRFPPMLIPPRDWEGQYNGGYYTKWFQQQAVMCSVRFSRAGQRAWVIENLESPRAAPVRAAMNKAQSTAYRVNKRVLHILQSALATRLGILGLPRTTPKPEPEFPFGKDWDKAEASESELDLFKQWKLEMSQWYTEESKRKGKALGIVGRARELDRYKDEVEIYFPTFIDFRGRVYFRGSLNPQSSDAVKGCLEFAKGIPLGERGLFWLKVHVANCCGYDKHTPEIKAKWVDDNWDMILDFINNPIEVDAPEPDTAFTLLQAGLALQEALTLPDPTSYVCHVPVAMDATCSGLQHLSALTRDKVGAWFTNLEDNESPKKEDIYMQVADTALTLYDDYIKDAVVKDFWESNPVTRSMAKKPVMTYVYGSTLLTTIDNLVLDLSNAGCEAIRTEDGRVAFSLNALATPIAKALRAAVVATVPKSEEIMKYLQMLVRKHRTTTMKWFTPVGVPVVNWVEGEIIKKVNIRSMGINNVYMKYRNGEYNVRAAANGIVPNFVHSMDSAHLCLTLNAADASILPIHDSFATHPSSVDELHYALRSTFIKMYKQYSLEELLIINNIDTDEFPIPCQGQFDLTKVESAPFMFC